MTREELKTILFICGWMVNSSDFFEKGDALISIELSKSNSTPSHLKNCVCHYDKSKFDVQTKIKGFKTYEACYEYLLEHDYL